MKKLSLGIMLVAVLLVGACVYDYTPPVPEGGGMLVINGDILIGRESEINISRTTEVGAELAGNLQVEAVYAEGSDGAVYPGTPDGNAVYHIDTQSADPSLEYRLVVQADGSVYESAWQPVLKAPAIDSLSYTISEDRKTLGMEISTHAVSDAEAGNRCYRWIVRQVWEYHAMHNAMFFFVPAGGTRYGVTAVSDTVVYYGDRINDYRCWKSEPVHDLMIASTEELSENRLVLYPIYSMGCRDLRTQDLYHTEVIQEAISPEAYRYYESVRNNSTNVGGLFSPQPSEMRGNIRNRDNKEENVLGYVSVTQPAVVDRFIDFNYFIFHRAGEEEKGSKMQSVPKQYWHRFYYSGYLPVYVEGSTENISSLFWDVARCVNCKCFGGTKNKPDWWPNDHR